MAEPGWPLIPREVLPAPVEPARVRSRRAAVTAAAPSGKQLSVFGVEAVDPSLADLAGLLAGPGTLGRMGGTARVAVQVDAAWRVHVLVEELVCRGLVVNWHPVAAEPPEERVAELVAVPVDEEAANETAAEQTTDEETAGEKPAEEPFAEEPSEAAGTEQGSEEAPPAAFEVRTAYSSRLNGLARSWPPPSGRLFLNGPRLRLWVAAAGSPRPQGYALGLNPDGLLDKAIDDALARVGLAGTIQAGPAYVIAGGRRLTRLAELIGERPAAAPARLWPGGAAA
ncbi:hypothetical protein COUCH_37665 [Couchioplanes caeruleus]|uniref:hypothetical protein n=1 Tax=Couchioplanes caeruleus TaxID=56438 RepID=UPI0020C10A5F|nr:hypothetical protein [Couchioplanes caeruleus]UQU64611.1 hypothetical protein COUCH_37665 [Couchioplanes caeruleus]